MFFLGFGSSIIPYILSLVIIWGVLLVNGIFKTQVQKEVHSEKIIKLTGNDLKSSEKGSIYFYHNNIKKKNEKVKSYQTDYQHFLMQSLILKIQEKITLILDNNPVPVTLLRAPPPHTIVNFIRLTV